MDEVEPTLSDSTVERAADIVSAYVAYNSLPPTEIAGLIATVHSALVGLGQTTAIEEAGPEKPTPAQIKKSITQDALISFEDGKSYKSMKRHLSLRGLTPGQYRTKWGLPVDYPVVAPSYSAQRSALAHSFGLGRWGAIGRRAAAASPTTEPADDPNADKPKTRGCPRKVKEQA